MADDMRQRQKRAAEFIEPFRVKPGSKVRLGRISIRRSRPE